jgi:predicted nucleic acid-binding protein
MTSRRTIRERFPQPARPGGFRYTIDASVFLNAFNRRERGHPESLRLLAAIEKLGDPVIVPALVVAEIASAIARTTNDRDTALTLARATASLPHVTLIPITAAMAMDTADIAATYRLRGSDASYVAVAEKYATTLVSLDPEHLTKGAHVAVCQTPQQALAHLGG